MSAKHPPDASSCYGLFLTEDGVALVGDLEVGLPAAAEDAFGPLQACRVVRGNELGLHKRWSDILRDLQDVGYAVI